MKKKTYISPSAILVNVQVTSPILDSSQTDWADAKVNHLSDDDFWEDDDFEDDGTNWAGYRKDTNLW